MMSSTGIWLTIAGLTAVSVITRNLFLVFGDRVVLPERLQHALRYAPACALAAVIVPEVVMQSGTLALHPGNPKLVAAVTLVAALLLTRRAVVALLAGILAYLLMRLL